MTTPDVAATGAAAAYGGHRVAGIPSLDMKREDGDASSPMRCPICRERFSTASAASLGGSCPKCEGDLGESVATPRTPLLFGGSPSEAALAPRGPWKGIAKGGEVHSPSAPVAAGAEGLHPARLSTTRGLRAMRSEWDAAPVAQPKLSTDESSALVQRGGSPLAGLEFKQSLPVIKDSDLDFDKHMAYA